jgi:predicted transcriptional regulator of viral defense system
VIGDLLIEGKLDPRKLIEVARVFPVAVVQRVGYLVEFMSRETSTAINLDNLASRVAAADITELTPSLPAFGGRDQRWRLQPNTQIEHDL